MNQEMLEGVKLVKFALQNEKLPKDVKSMIIFFLLMDFLLMEGPMVKLSK